VRVDRAKGNVLAVADSFTDLVDHATRGRDETLASSRPRRSHDVFYSCESFDAAAQAFLFGEDAPSLAIDALRDDVRRRIGNLDVADFRFEHDIVGRYLDVSTFLSGGTHFMLNPVEDTTRRRERFIRILVDVTYWNGVRNSDIVTRGGAIIALCDVLNYAGFTTEVFAGVSIKTRDKPLRRFGLVCPIQVRGSSWDTRSAAFPLANGDYLRRMTFAVMESLTQDERATFNVGGGYGLVEPIRKDDAIDTDIGGADIIVDSSRGSISEVVNDPYAWIMSKCKNVGAIRADETN
jgi:hypothetical protein